MKIQLSGVKKSFDGKQVIQPTDLCIKSGCFTTLLGPSGCGKTTLLRMIAGLETPDDGEIWFDDISRRWDAFSKGLLSGALAG